VTEKKCVLTGFLLNRRIQKPIRPFQSCYIIFPEENIYPLFSADEMLKGAKKE